MQKHSDNRCRMFFNAFPRARNDSMLKMRVHGRARVKENMYVDMI